MLVGWVLAIVLAFAPTPLYSAYVVARAPAGRALRARRPADRGRRDVGAGLDRVHDRVHRLLLPLARPGAAGAPSPDPRASASRAPPIPDLRGEAMLLIVASHFLAGSLLTLLLPVGLLVAVGLYWAWLIRRRSTRSPGRARRMTESRRLRSPGRPRRRPGECDRDRRRRRALRARFAPLFRRRAPAPCPPSTARPSGPQAHAPRPASALRDQNGAPVSLASLRGRPVLLTFLDSQCQLECPIAGATARLDPAAAARRQAAGARRRQRRSLRRHAGEHPACRDHVGPRRPVELALAERSPEPARRRVALLRDHRRPELEATSCTASSST